MHACMTAGQQKYCTAIFLLALAACSDITLTRIIDAAPASWSRTTKALLAQLDAKGAAAAKLAVRLARADVRLADGGALPRAAGAVPA
jgi:hypothetical protein